jgi:DNA-binding IclR family transcriptional regulator
MVSDNRIKAAETSFEILDIISESGGATAIEIADRLGLSRGGVYKHIRTLQHVGAIENEGGTYVIGHRIAYFAGKSAPGQLSGDTDTPFGRNQLDPVVDLSMSIDSPVNTWTLEGTTCRCVHTCLPDVGRENPRAEGDEWEITSAVPGRAILATLDDERRRRTVGTLDDDVDEKLGKARRRGVLIEPLETVEGWQSVSAPIMDENDTAVGAIEAVLPSERAQGIDLEVNIVGQVLDTARRLHLEERP